MEKCLNLEFFKKEGFARKKCKKCSSHFWTTDPQQEICGDSPCIEYSFINNPLGKNTSLHSMRENFLSFFEKREHERMEKYPTVARWRDDIYLTIASIADFQPHVTSGEVPPPMNPLVISQPSIRLNDLESVGKSGRHLTMFEMMGHHAFNNDEKIYWTEATAEYCNDFMKSIGISTDKITYKEALWFGGGNAGPCFEVLAGGLELATLVFMNMREDKNGDHEIDDKRYSEMSLKIVDTGYGLERLVWITKGTSTVYDAVFPNVIQLLVEEGGIERNDEMIGEASRLASSDFKGNFMKEMEKRMERKVDGEMLKNMENVYTLADHARCLAFMLGDGIVPSNMGAGYLARLIIRRSLRLLSVLDLSLALDDVVGAHIKNLSNDFPELLKSLPMIEEILDIEAEKFAETLNKGKRLVKRSIKEKKEVAIENLVDFYDTHGISPDVVKEVAEPTMKVEIPKNFDLMIAEKHATAVEEKKIGEKRETEEIPNFDTKLLFYEKPEERKFKAVVLWKKKSNEKSKIILDQTLFYPEGGGQPCDLGYLWSGDERHRVLDVYKENGSVVHVIDGEIKGKVHGEIDWARRFSIMQHHTATHIINASARKVLGEHIWQAGSQLGEKEARLDVSHYKRITDDQQRRIELIANGIVMDGTSVKKEWMERNVAEKKYGFRLYQGGAPKGNTLRIVEIPGVDTEACGGTHCENTSDVGFIKITGIERLQDGIERIMSSAGKAATEYVQEQEKLMKEACDVLNVDSRQLPRAVKRFFEEWKDLRKEVERLKEKKAADRAAALLNKAKKIGGMAIISDVQEGEMKELISLAGELIKKNRVVAILGSKKGKLVVARSRGVDIDCREIVKEAAKIVGGSGGGKPDMAQGGGPNADKIEKAMETAKKMVEERLALKNQK